MLITIGKYKWDTASCPIIPSVAQSWDSANYYLKILMRKSKIQLKILLRPCRLVHQSYYVTGVKL